ncbi:MAG: HRDC domain-containing protein [Acidimicrobiia bacterium]|nr:HRDC domain-containing protein [Acidimicrobiia bacterium]
MGREYLRAEGGVGSLDGFLAFLTASLRGDSGGSEGDDAVDLVTFHRSKGLEWHTVFITGVESGYVPINHAKTPGELAEERRLFYVACTRVQRSLHITWATRRTFGTREVTRRPGPFLVDMGLRPGTPGSKRSGSSSTGRPPATRVDELRAALRAGNSSGDPDDDALAEDLREWRLTRSRAAGVPAYVVFADRTLAEVVVDRPTTHGELLAVSGIGPVKAERFGPEILDIVKRHAGTRTQTGRQVRTTARTG